MADPAVALPPTNANDGHTDATEETEAERRARLQREREAQIEQMMMNEEEDERNPLAAGAPHNNNDDNNNNNNNNDNDNNRGENADLPNDNEFVQAFVVDNNNNNNGGRPRVPAAAAASSGKFFNYTRSSLLAAMAALVYALRTREQWYLALVYLGSSKWAYCVLGNALVALAVQSFGFFTHLFLNGLRLHEAEGLQDFFRWNVTETCLALTMFRSELSVQTAVEFVILILAKCLHHVSILRQQHLRMTDDAIQPAAWNRKFPTVPARHWKILSFFLLLQTLDLWALQHAAADLMQNGPSVSILFAFEAAILLVSAWSNILLWNLHMVDGLLHFAHDQEAPRGSLAHALGRWLHTWKEHKATLTFAVELQSQTVQFLFYLAFFGFILTYYGIPINLFRELYVSFAALKERLFAFFKYRRLMASMNRFQNPTEEALEEAGRVCIICRDEMTVEDCKELPTCRHMFHKSCLREWLTQQQSCPTCRADISAMEAQAAAARQAAARQQVAPAPPPEAPPQSQQQQPEATVQSEEAAQTETEAPVVSAEDRTASRCIPVPPVATATEASPPSPTENQSPAATSELSTDPVEAAATRQAITRQARLRSFTPRKVRFAPGQAQPTPQPHEILPFPALYRVVCERGTQVWRWDDDHHKGERTMHAGANPTAIRTVPLGSIVLGKAQAYKTFVEQIGDNDDDEEEERIVVACVELPDGWVLSDTVRRVYTIS